MNSLVFYGSAVLVALVLGGASAWWAVGCGMWGRFQCGAATLFYLDPPYVHETRATTGNYEHEMTEDDHRELLAVIKQCQGRVLLSGYPNPLYDGELAGWRRADFEIDNKAAGGKVKRQMTESVWMNF